MNTFFPYDLVKIKTVNLCLRVTTRFLNERLFISDLIFVTKVVGLKSTFHNVRCK